MIALPRGLFRASRCSPSLQRMNVVAMARSAACAWKSVIGDADLEAMPWVRNAVWRLTSNDGRQFVLKRLPDVAPGVSPVDEFRILAYLQSAGIPVVPPICTDAGTINAATDHGTYVLLPLLPNDLGNHDLGPDAPETTYAIGAAIGRLNEALRQCPWRVDTFTDDPADRLLRALAELPEEATVPVLPRVADLRAAVAHLPLQRTHGDCNTGNVLVHDSRVSGFVDLDHLPLGPRVRDLSYYLASRLQQSLLQPSTADRDRHALVRMLGNYVAGYDEVVGLSEYERAAIVPLIMIVEVGVASWALHEPTPDLSAYQRGVHSFTWLSGHLDEVISAAHDRNR